MHNGDVLEIDAAGKAKRGARVESGAVLVDGVMLGEFEGSLLRERKELSESGILVVSLVIDDEYRLAAPLQVDSRGSIYGFDRDAMRPDVESSVERALESVRAGAVDGTALPTEIRKRIRDVISKNYRAYPGIMPIINMISDGKPINPDGSSKPRASRRSSRSSRSKNRTQ
jgi:ribonuclease J